MTLPAACLTGDSHGQSKEARSGAQEELETRQRKRQACAQVGGKARDAEKSEVQGPARRHEREETRGREKAAAGPSGKKTSGADASRNHGHRRHREIGLQTSYAAASWSKPRKVVARVEASEQGSDIRFIVTNLPGRAKVLYEKVYCARGRMENLIKDMKLYTRSDRTSCHRWEANQFRLFLHMGAYWLLHELRGAAPKRSIWRTATFETIRCTFLKIAVRIQELKTRIKMALPSSYPHVQALTALATSIAALAP